MSIYSRIIDDIGKGFAINYWALTQEEKEAVANRKMFIGEQQEQLVVGAGKTNDNVMANVVGLNINRSVSHVLYGGVEFDLGEGMEAQQEYLDNLWEVNQKLLTLTNGEIDASVYGTGYIKIIPNGEVDPYTNEQYPRLVVLNPEYLRINTDTEDMGKIESYVVEYSVSDEFGQTTYRETTRRAKETDSSIDDAGNVTPIPSDTWIIVYEKKSDQISNRWETWKPTLQWPYNFPPIIHWQNQPNISDVYGVSDMRDVKKLQDKLNFSYSNTQKIVRLQANKQLWARGMSAEQITVGIDKIIKLVGPDSDVGVLDTSADIPGTLSYSLALRQTIADIMREVDITSITDKLGALTNFGLRVLYSDSLAKNDLKRMLLGEMLEELNRRLLVLAGNEGEASRPGEVVWHDPLPSNRVEDIAADAVLLSNGLVSKQTLSEKYGYDWEAEQERIAGEKGSQDNAIGAALLRSFPGIGTP